MADENKNAVPEEKAESGWATPEEPAAAPASDVDISASQQKNLSRPSAHEIYQQVAKNAKEELRRSSVSLAISGFTGGIFMGLSALGVGLALARLGESPSALCSLADVLSAGVHRGDPGAVAAVYGKHAVPGGPGADGAAADLEYAAAVGDGVAFEHAGGAGICGAGGTDPCDAGRTWCTRLRGWG